MSDRHDPDKKRLQAYLQPETSAALDESAEREGRSTSAVAQDALESYLGDAGKSLASQLRMLAGEIAVELGKVFHVLGTTRRPKLSRLEPPLTAIANKSAQALELLRSRSSE